MAKHPAATITHYSRQQHSALATNTIANSLNISSAGVRVASQTRRFCHRSTGAASATSSSASTPRSWRRQAVCPENVHVSSFRRQAAEVWRYSGKPDTPPAFVVKNRLALHEGRSQQRRKLAVHELGHGVKIAAPALSKNKAEAEG